MSHQLTTFSPTNVRGVFGDPKRKVARVGSFSASGATNPTDAGGSLAGIETAIQEVLSKEEGSMRRILCMGGDNAVRTASFLRRFAPLDWTVAGKTESWTNIDEMANDDWMGKPLKNSKAGDIFLLDLASDFAYRDTSSTPLADPDHMSTLGMISYLSPETRTFVNKLYDIVSGVSRLANVYVLAPLPRYVRTKCCSRRTHMTNWSEEFVLEHIMRQVKELEVVMKFKLGAKKNVRVIAPSDFICGQPSVMATAFHFGMITEDDGATLTDKGIAELAELIV